MTPTTPSFLDLIPELRNAVYELLFKSGSAVVISPRIHSAPDDECTDVACRQDPTSTYFVHGFQHSLALLRCCRQINREASGVLYGSNVFVVAAPEHPRAGRAAGLHWRHVEHAAMWLSGLGHQQSRLAKVAVDVGATCHGGKPGLFVTFDLLPLLRLVWQHPQLGDALTFEDTGRVLPHKDPYPASHCPGISAAASNEALALKAVYLTNVLRVLGRDDALQLKRYAYSPRLLHSVPVGAQRGSVFHERAASSDAVLYRAFTTINAGAGVRLLSARSEGWDGGLPLRIWEAVYDFASPRGGIVLHLDSREVRGLGMPLLHLNRALRTALRRHAVRSHATTIQIASTSRTADCSAFDVPPGSALAASILPATRSSSRAPYVLRLVFKLSACDTLADLRIDIAGFVRHLCDPTSHAFCRLDVALHCEAEPPRTEDSSTCTADLEARVFVLLCRVVSRLRGADLATDPGLPQLWVSGRGALLEARYAGAGSGRPSV